MSYSYLKKNVKSQAILFARVSSAEQEKRKKYLIN